MIHPDISLLQPIPLLALVINCNVAPALCMLQVDDVAAMEFKLRLNYIVRLSKWNNLPFLKVLTNIGLIPIEQVFWVSSSFRRLRPKLRLHTVVRSSRYFKVLTEVDVSIVFNVVE